MFRQSVFLECVSVLTVCLVCVYIECVCLSGSRLREGVEGRKQESGAIKATLRNNEVMKSWREREAGEEGGFLLLLF